MSVCIETFFTDLDYRERIERIAELGFRHYEFWFADKRFDGANLTDEPKDLDMLAELNAKHGLVTADFVFNHPDGGCQAALIDKRGRTKLRDGIGRTIEDAKKIGCTGLISGAGNVVPGISKEEAVESMVEALSELGDVCGPEGITLLLEPFNTKVDHPDYFLDDPMTTLEVVRAVDKPSVKILFDIYHMQIMSGNITDFVRENIRHIGHFHVAAVPGRHEPDAGELNYPFIIDEIDKLGYDGCVGLEYWPTVDAAESLKRSMSYLRGKPSV